MSVRTPAATRVRGQSEWLRRHPREWSKLRVGVTALVVLAVLVGATVSVNSLHLSEDTYHADFAQAAGIGAGDPVTDAGIPIGTVTAVRLDGDHVVVTMKVKHSVALGDQTRAAIKLTTLLGSRYLELRPSGTGTLPNREIPLSQTEVPYDLQSAIEDVTTTFGQIDADQVANSLSTMSAQLRGTPALVPETLRNIQTLSAIIAQRRGQIGQLLISTDQVTTVIRNQQKDMATLVTEGRTVLQEIISRQQAITRLLDATTTLVHQLEPIVVDNKPEVQQLIANLTSMTAMIAGHDNLLRSILQILPLPWRLFANATGQGDELVGFAPDGAFIDTFMCALSERAKQLHQPEYLKDCK
jgi:virulence factor Mce-like protein